jgi:hypothetical protein
MASSFCVRFFSCVSAIAFIAVLHQSLLHAHADILTAKELSARPEIQREITRGEPLGAAKVKFQYGTASIAGSPRRFLVFQRTQIENGEPLDSELLVVAVEKKGAALVARIVFRDVSVMGLRESRKAGLSEAELQAVFLAQGRHDLERMGGSDPYLRFARQRLLEGEVSGDERRVFDQLLGKDWDRQR